MTHHAMWTERALRHALRTGRIRCAGNRKLRIYGTLHCTLGKKMRRENRVFFESAEEARLAGYRPCAKCMPLQYAIWRRGHPTASGSSPAL